MKIVTERQYDNAWWAARRGVPTCSEFSSIITAKEGEYAKTAARTYICRLLGDLSDPQYGQVETYTSAAMKNGSMLEPEARGWYQFDKDVKVETVGFCTSDDGRFGYSPDSLVGEDGLVEGKSPMAHTHLSWLLEGGLPSEHRAQCHGGLIVSGREWIDFLSYHPTLPPLLVRVTPDDYTKKLRDHLERFWTEYQAARKKLESLGWNPVPLDEPPIEEEGPSSPQAALLAMTE